MSGENRLNPKKRSTQPISPAHFLSHLENLVVSGVDTKFSNEERKEEMVTFSLFPFPTTLSREEKDKM